MQLDREIKKILLITSGGIGNIIMFLPTIHHIKEQFPSSDISVVTEANGSLEILSNNPNIKEVLIYITPNRNFRGYLKLIKKLRKKHFDLAIVMFPQGLRSALMAFLSGTPLRIGYDMPLLRGLGRFLYTHLLESSDVHDVEQNLNMFNSLGIKINQTEKTPRVFIPDNYKKIAKEYLLFRGIAYNEMIIGFQPGSNSSAKWKRWPAKYYKELIEFIISNWEISIIIFGNTNEDSLITEIVSGIKGTSVKIIKIVDRNIMETAALIELCSIFICNDSGLMHLAAASGIETVCICGPTNIKKTGPYGPNSHVIHSDLKCLFCYNFNTINFKCPKEQPYQCLNELYPREVFKKLQPILLPILNKT